MLWLFAATKDMYN